MPGSTRAPHLSTAELTYPALRPVPALVGDTPVLLQIRDRGTVDLPNGVLGIGDPTVTERGAWVAIRVPPGSYPVVATQFELQTIYRERWTRNAAISLLFSHAPEVRRGPLPDGLYGDTAPDALHSLWLQQGMVSLVDATALASVARERGELQTTFWRWIAPHVFRDRLSPAPYTRPLPRRSERILVDTVDAPGTRATILGGYDAAGQLAALHVIMNNVRLPEGAAREPMPLTGAIPKLPGARHQRRRVVQAPPVPAYRPYMPEETRRVLQSEGAVLGAGREVGPPAPLVVHDEDARGAMPPASSPSHGGASS